MRGLFANEFTQHESDVPGIHLEYRCIRLWVETHPRLRALDRMHVYHVTLMGEQELWVSLLSRIRLRCACRYLVDVEARVHLESLE